MIMTDLADFESYSSSCSKSDAFPAVHAYLYPVRSCVKPALWVDMSVATLKSCNTLSAGVDLLATNCSAPQTQSMDLDAMIAVPWIIITIMEYISNTLWVHDLINHITNTARGVAGQDCGADQPAEWPACGEPAATGLARPSRSRALFISMGDQVGWFKVGVCLKDMLPPLQLLVTMLHDIILHCHLSILS